MFRPSPTNAIHQRIHLQRCGYYTSPNNLSAELINSPDGTCFLNIGFSDKPRNPETKETEESKEFAVLSFHQSTFSSSVKFPPSSSISIHRNEKEFSIIVYNHEEKIQTDSFTITGDLNLIADWAIYISELLTTINAMKISIDDYSILLQLKNEFIKAIRNILASPKREEREAACIKFVASIPIILETTVVNDLEKLIKLRNLDSDYAKLSTHGPR